MQTQRKATDFLPAHIGKQVTTWVIGINRSRSHEREGSRVTYQLQGNPPGSFSKYIPIHYRVIAGDWR